MTRTNRLASTSIALMAALIALAVPEIGRAGPGSYRAEPMAPLHDVLLSNPGGYHSPGHGNFELKLSMDGSLDLVLPPDLGPATAPLTVSLSSSRTIDDRGFSGGGGRRYDFKHCFVSGDGTEGGSEWRQNFNPECQSCPQIDWNTVRIALVEQRRVLGPRTMSVRSMIYDWALTLRMRGGDPRSRPGVLGRIRTLIADARRDEERYGGLRVAVRAVFFPRGKFAIADAPRGEDMLNAVKAAAAKMTDPIVLVFGMASRTSGEKAINTDIADLRAITVANDLRSKLEKRIEVHGVEIYALQEAGFELTSGQVEKYFGRDLLPESPSGDQDTPDSVSNQAAIVLVVSRRGPFVVLQDSVELDWGS